jgi:hypothetical protein
MMVATAHASAAAAAEPAAAGADRRGSHGTGTVPGSFPASQVAADSASLSHGQCKAMTNFNLFEASAMIV